MKHTQLKMFKKFNFLSNAYILHIYNDFINFFMFLKMFLNLF